ncbi:MAG: hypothetical protein LBJ67_02025 [Planctomycetaceae bacterium]|jgi:hypothetical protein|nr:hypothetical protein [Planctomycetaceae bacterium]
MITSSLPPEWKVLIAGGILLGGMLVAFRFPAKRDLIQASVNAVRSLETNANSSETAVASTPNPTLLPTSVATESEGRSAFVSSDDFLDQNADVPVSVADYGFGTTAYRKPSETSVTASDNVSNTLPHVSYGGWNIADSPNSAEKESQLPLHSREIAAENQSPEAALPSYIPFNPPLISQPPPDPDFFVDLPSPPTLASSLAESHALLPSSINVADILSAHPETSISNIPPLPVAPSAPATSSAVAVHSPIIVLRTLKPIGNPVSFETTHENKEKNISSNHVIVGSGRAVILPND